MTGRQFGWTAAVGCGVLILILIVGGALLLTPLGLLPVRGSGEQAAPVVNRETGAQQTQVAIPTLTLAPPVVEAQPPIQESLTALYQQTNPGVVNIRVFVGQMGQGAGSGFILDEEGHIVTNYHVVAEAGFITVIFNNGFEAPTEIVGLDPESDLAVIRVETLPEGTRPLSLGDSGEVQVGEPVVAIGNPFGFGSSIVFGIVSAIGRLIPAAVTPDQPVPFSIPQAIQTDAAINPGNSGGPLINMQGQVIGVNAQIATGGQISSAGVGFAIPSNIVRRVVPVLIETGTFEWPWLGVRGTPVNLLIAEANELPTQQGAYIHEVIPGSPADRAGLEGSTGVEAIGGFEVPVGGDVVVEADGEPVEDFAELLYLVSSHNPEDTMTLTVLRDGQRQQITVQLEPRPQGQNQDNVLP